MDIGLRRLILVILSLISGIVGVFVILLLLDVKFESYGVEYAVLTALPLAVFVGIWLDHFMGTKLLADGPGEADPARPVRGGTASEE